MFLKHPDAQDLSEPMWGCKQSGVLAWPPSHPRDRERAALKAVEQH